MHQAHICILETCSSWHEATVAIQYKPGRPIQKNCSELADPRAISVYQRLDYSLQEHYWSHEEYDMHTQDSHTYQYKHVPVQCMHGQRVRRVEPVNVGSLIRDACCGASCDASCMQVRDGATHREQHQRPTRGRTPPRCPCSSTTSYFTHPPSLGYPATWHHQTNGV